MRANLCVRNLSILCAALVALLGCAEPRVRQQGTPAESVEEAATIELGERLASLQKYVSQMEETYAAQEAEIRVLQRYAAQMEETYATQEAEILTLRREIADSARCGPQVSPAARLASNAVTARQAVTF